MNNDSELLNVSESEMRALGAEADVDAEELDEATIEALVDGTYDEEHRRLASDA